MKEAHILNLGAGVQSTTLYLMSMRGEIQPFDFAIFADTQEEPGAEARRLGLPDTEGSVYHHLDWMISLGGPEIIITTTGKLGDDLIQGSNSTGGRFASIPAFTTSDGGETTGITRRQCSKEYKTEAIERAIRRTIFELKDRSRIPKGCTVHQYFGISQDEAGRASRIYERFLLEKNPERWRCYFPLLERQFTRANCHLWLERFGNVPHKVPRSACVFCPFHDDAEWQSLKDKGGPDWARVVQIDHSLRTTGSVANRNMAQVMYLHRACKPIDQITFRPRENAKAMQLGFGDAATVDFRSECEGVCGV